MKRLIAVLSGLLVLPAFAEVAPLYYDEIIEYTDTEMSGDEFVADDDFNGVSTPVSSPVSAPKATPRTNTTATNRAAAARTAPTSSSATSSGRTMSTRTVSSRNTANAVNSARTATATRTSTTRATTTRNAAAKGAPVTTNSAVRARAGTASSSGTMARASIVQTDTVNTPLYTGRVGVRTSATGVSARVPTIRASGTSLTGDVSTTSVSTASDMDELAQITDFCKAQYMQCMDNYCNVLDDNQGRCSCSKNLKNYEKTENALKQATQELQDLAQKIQYIGLAADEVTSLFEQTEAEAAMQNKTDTTQLKNDLDKIKSMVLNVKSGSSSSGSVSSGLTLDGFFENLSFSSTTSDLGEMFGFGTSANTASINNQRGETLYKTAAARCKASVLNSCTNQGVDVSVITNAYDLEIDKHCIAYERSLNEANDQMISTVRNAKNVLQKARYVVAREKKLYDMRECINALDTCVQDDFVCGSDYENCLDSTGKYIVNGAVVPGSLPGQPGDVSGGVYGVWKYMDGSDIKNAWSEGGSLTKFISSSAAYDGKTVPTTMAEYIKQKIGYIDEKGRVQGMCSAVLAKCQDYTFDNSGNYKKDNDVVNGYLERVLVQIKASQDSVLSSYAESCIASVASCLSKNKYNSGDDISGAALNACKSEIVTCQSVNGKSGDKVDHAWIESTFSVSVGNQTVCTSSGGTWNNNHCECPSSSVLDVGFGTCTKDDRAKNCVNSNGAWSLGVCTCETGKKLNENGTCVAKN